MNLLVLFYLHWFQLLFLVCNVMKALNTFVEFEQYVTVQFSFVDDGVYQVFSLMQSIICVNSEWVERLNVRRKRAVLSSGK